MANLRVLFAFGIGLLVFAETVQAAPKRSRSRQPSITVIQLPAAASPCCCNGGGSAGNVTAVGAPMVITVNGVNHGVSVQQEIAADNVTVGAPVITENNKTNSSTSVTTTSVQQIGNVTVGAPVVTENKHTNGSTTVTTSVTTTSVQQIGNVTVTAATVKNEISGGGMAASVAEQVSDDGRIGRGVNSPVYERLRKAVLAWQAVPENFALCGKEDPDNTVPQFLEEMHMGWLGDRSKSDKVKAHSMVGWNVAILTATGRTCAGTLVSNRHITFAASCMLDETHAANLTVLFNVLSINHKFESYVKSNDWNVVGVKAVGQHPLHKPDVLQQDNVALLELQKDAPLGGVAKIRPACILPEPVLDSNYSQVEHCLMTSYEANQTNPSDPASLTFHNGENFIQFHFCKMSFPMFQPERQMCAKSHEGVINKDMVRCPGLVGAGLLCQIQIGSRAEERKWYLVGVASYSESSCDGLAVFQDMWTGFAADNSTAHP